MILQKTINFKWGDTNNRKGGDLTATVEKERQMTFDQYVLQQVITTLMSVEML